MAAQLPPCPDKVIKKAREYVTDMNNIDRRFKKLPELLTADISGNSAHDYNVVEPLASLTQNHPLDPELAEQLEQVQVHSMFGLFPEINRAWLSVDKQIYLWNLSDGTDFCVYKELAEVIVGVALVKPRPGSFDPRVEYLLCLATPSTVSLVGVEFQRTAEGQVEELNLDADAHYVTSTDNVAMTCLIGGPDGRIFMGGNDGAVYELQYEKSTSWLFGYKCRKINHSQSMMDYIVPSILSSVFGGVKEEILQLCYDASRNVVYARSKNSIQAYLVDVNGLTKAKTLYDGAAHQQRYSKHAHGSIIHIAVVPAEVDNSTIGLVGVTDKGTRLYFTTRHQTRYIITTGMVSSPIDISKVRVLPSLPGTPEIKVEQAAYAEGVLTLATVDVNGGHSVMMVSPRLFNAAARVDSLPRPKGKAPHLEEEVLTWRFPALCAVNAIAQLPRRTLSNLTFNPLAGQFLEPLTFALLTTMGTFEVDVARPVDKFRARLAQGEDLAGMAGFFQLPDDGDARTNSSGLTFASTIQQQQGLQPEERLERLMDTQVYCREACATAMVVAAGMHQADLALRKRAITALQRFQGQPVQLETTVVQPQGMFGKAAAGPQILHSGLHDGVALFFGRLVRDFWLEHMFQPVDPSNPQALRSAVPASVLGSASDRLSRFWDAFAVTCDSQLEQAGASLAVEEGTPQQEEVKSLYGLYSLMVMTHEAIQFWLLLCEEDRRLPELTAQLTPDQRRQLQTSTFAAWVTSEVGLDLSRALIDKLLRQMSSRGPAGRQDHDHMCERLHNLCPSLFHQEDVMRAKAMELLQLAKLMPADKQAVINAKDQLARTAKQFNTLQGLDQACQLLVDMRAWKVGVDLVVECVQLPSLKPAVMHFRRNQPEDDATGRRALTQCQDLHQLLFGPNGVVTKLYQAYTSATAGSEQRQQLQTELDKQLYSVLMADDELLDYALFHWLLQNGEDARLVEAQSSRVEPYLQQRRQQLQQVDPAGSRACLQLLMRHYIARKQFAKAGTLSAELAQAQDSSFTLDDRVEHLATAIKNMSSEAPRTTAISESLRQLIDIRDVARIQSDVQGALQARGVSTDVVKGLDRGFLPLTELYEDYCLKYDLHECTLAAMMLAGAVKQIDTVWINIIESQGQGNNLQLEPLAHHVASVARPYRESNAPVPLQLIVQRIEEFAAHQLHQGELPPSDFKLVVQELNQTAGYSWQDLYEVYHSLSHNPERYHWGSIGARLHIYRVLAYILESWAAENSSDPRLRQVCDRDLSSLLTETRRHGNDGITIAEQFRAVQQAVL
eukprot:TRINITY_DN12562_c0_g2_i1.p1 TRINITY_DN12562_c0_g2~~TRINITY_DN12562_c0_g2_i1.p1  ORF type:complete len:1292 (+),score=380.00 TRINITY_DN12562_c0_g2_i1:19-3894(+)